MGMREFQYLTSLRLDIELPKPYVEPPKNQFTLEKPKEVTLAEYAVESRDVIVAHRLCDYRRRKFSLVLLPNVHILFEDLLSCDVST